MSLISKDRLSNILEKISSIDPLLVIGDVGIDKYTYGEVSRISPEAPVPVLHVQKEWKKLGLAANISDNLSSLGVKSTLIGVVGNDERASKLESMLEDKNLSTWGIIRDDSITTTFKERVTTNIQQICRIDYEDVGSIPKPVEDKVFERLTEFLSSHSGVILEDYNKGLVTDSLAQRILKLCREENKFVAIDPYRSKSPAIYSHASLFKPNFAEAKQLAESLGLRSENPEEMCRFFFEKLSVSKVAITLGAQGMALFDSANNYYQLIPTVANEVFDVSGAGDTVISTIVSAMISGATLEEAAWIGNCAAGVVVAKKGTATVTVKELLAFYDLLSARIV